MGASSKHGPSRKGTGGKLRAGPGRAGPGRKQQETGTRSRGPGRGDVSEDITRTISPRTKDLSEKKPPGQGVRGRPNRPAGPPAQCAPRRRGAAGQAWRRGRPPGPARAAHGGRGGGGNVPRTPHPRPQRRVRKVTPTAVLTARTGPVCADWSQARGRGGRGDSHYESLRGTSRCPDVPQAQGEHV